MLTGQEILCGDPTNGETYGQSKVAFIHRKDGKVNNWRKQLTEPLIRDLDNQTIRPCLACRPTDFRHCLSILQMNLPITTVRGPGMWGSSILWWRSRNHVVCIQNSTIRHLTGGGWQSKRSRAGTIWPAERPNGTD